MLAALLGHCCLPGAGRAVEGPAEVVGVGGVAGQTRRGVLPLPAQRLLERVPAMRTTGHLKLPKLYANFTCPFDILT